MKRGAVAKAYRELLRAVNKHLSEEDAKRRFREYVNQEFRSNSALMDPLDVRRKVMLAKDYTFLLNSVHHHKELLFSYNIAVDRSDEMKRVIGRSAASVGLRLPDVYYVDRSFPISIRLKEEYHDNKFHSLLGISSSSWKEKAIMDVKSTTKWKNLQTLIKSYLQTTIFLIHQVTDSELLGFSLMRLRASTMLFVAFPSLLHRLIKVLVHLWATSEEKLSSCAFLVIHDVASSFGTDWLDRCLLRTYQAYIVQWKFVEPRNLQHICLRDNIIELCSIDIPRSSNKAGASVQHLGKILQYALRTKNREAVKKICSWQYVKCIDLWVEYVSANIRDFDLQPLCFTIIKIINGVACLFSGPRYLPLKIICIQWLDNLSRSSGVFIPVTSYVLDMLEFVVGKEGGKSGKDFDVSSFLNLPKHLLKSQNFEEQCVLAAIKLLGSHFDQWSHFIAFPELATMPVIHLKKFHEMTKNESFRRVVKQFIDQVEQNIEFVQKKRDEVAFSPKDQLSVDAFRNTSFKQYYSSLMKKVISKSTATHQRVSSVDPKEPVKKRRGPASDMVVACPNNQENGGKTIKKRKT